MLAVLAFSFVHFGLLAIRDAALAHAIWAIPIVIVMVLIFIPGAGLAMLAFARTTLGRIAIACVLAGCLGWEVRGYIDGVATLRRQVEQAAVDARAAVAAADARAADANARLALVAHQARVAIKLEADATDRAATNEAAILQYQQREAVYEASLTQPRLTHRTADRLSNGARQAACLLGAADISGLRHAAGAFDGAVAPRRTRKLWPSRSGS